jgi:hypothetical protein
MMLNISSALHKRFAACLHAQAILRHAQAAYHKSLRYELNFADSDVYVSSLRI